MRQPARIHVRGASGTGTSTFGRFVANKLQAPFLDTDAFYWLPIDPQFREKRAIPERVARLRAAMAQSADWVLSGSMVSTRVGTEFVSSRGRSS